MGSPSSTLSGLTSEATAILQKVAADLPSLFFLLKYLSTLFGLIMCSYALYRVVEDQKRGESMVGATSLFFIGIGLFNLSFLVDSATLTLGFSDSALSTFSYSSGSGSGSGSGLPSSALAVLKFFGWLAALRAFILWGESAQSGSPQGTVWRGTTHFVAGILMINLTQFLGVVGSYIS